LPADLQLTYSLHATYKLNKGKLSMCTSWRHVAGAEV
jgi:hypothetical protein